MTETRGNRKVYDSRPHPDLMLARAKRDRVDPATMTELIAPIRHYALRCYGHPVYETHTDLWTSAVTRTLVGYCIYTTRRDGKINGGWPMVRLADLIEVGDLVFLDEPL